MHEYYYKCNLENQLRMSVENIDAAQWQGWIQEQLGIGLCEDNSSQRDFISVK